MIEQRSTRCHKPGGRSNRLRVGVAAALVVVGLSGLACSGSDVPPQSGEEVLAAIGAPKGVSPLEAVFGFAERGEDPLIEAERRFQEEVQLCMRAQGFEYVMPDLALVSSVPVDKFGLSDADFAEQFGFGQITQLDAYLKNSAANTSADSGDPNAALKAAMTPDEAAAWDIAAFGKQFDLDIESGELIDPDTGEAARTEDVPIRERGCEGMAHDRAFGARSELLADLADELDQLDDRIAADAAVVSLRDAWQRCMSDEGLDYVDPQAMQADIDERVDEFMAAVFGLDLSAHPSIWNGHGLSTDQLSTTELAALAEAERYEINVAIADVKCSGTYDAGYAEVRDTYQLDFVATHAAAISKATR